MEGAPSQKTGEENLENEGVITPTECFCTLGGPVRESCKLCPSQRRRNGTVFEVEADEHGAEPGSTN